MGFKVVKQSGDFVNFDPAKLRRSLVNSGANDFVVDTIMRKIQDEIFEGISTKQIYKIAFSLLKRDSNSQAARYNLRSAIRLLGPAGFFFEKYIARLFAAENYEVVTNKTLQGKCVSHEVDVVVKKNNIIAMIECKFHGGRDAVTDVKIPLYIFSRFNDLKEQEHTVFSKKDHISECWIVTNNRFSGDAIQFATCSGIKLLSWDFPLNNNLNTKNYNESLYPVTCLTTLSLAEKDKLLILDIILAKELVKNSAILEKIEMSPKRIKNVLKEVDDLCKSC